MKAIETQYKGYRFRSRLEARWAVFFDALEIEWEYEKEGFDLGGEKYLPDFWLKTVNMWAEVKPEVFNERESRLVYKLAAESKRAVLFLVGTPDDKPYSAAVPDGDIFEYCLTNYKEYPKREHRFYACPADHERNWPDTEFAAGLARSSGFEFGEHGVR